MRPGETQKKTVDIYSRIRYDRAKFRTFVRDWPRSGVLEGKMNKEDKLKALDAALTQIEKAYGKGSVMKLGDSGANMNIETIPTGSLKSGYCTGTGRCSEGTNHRGIRTGVQW